MYSKCVCFVFCLTILQFTHGQNFWSDYTYLDEIKSFYKLHTVPKTWEDAKTSCERESASLFYPKNEEEAQVVISHFEDMEPFINWFFIGLVKGDNNFALNTIHGKPLRDFYANWGVGEPNNANGDEFCVTMNYKGKLNDEMCRNKYPFICEKAMASVTWNELCQTPDPQYKFNNVEKKCYKLHSTPNNWTEAYAVCKAEHSYLAVINSEDERDYLVSLLNQSKRVKSRNREAAHLGFYKKDFWITITGEPLHESEYKDWDTSQPDGGINENCGAMSLNGKLNDVACYQSMIFICEHEVPYTELNVGTRNSDDETNTHVEDQGIHGDQFFRNDYNFTAKFNHYKFHKLHTTWNEAKKICERESASLFYPTDSDEATIVIEYWKQVRPSVNTIFIGIANWIVKDVLDTVDGVPLLSVYNEWKYGEPNNAGGHDGCVVINKDGSLADDNCKMEYPFFCKKPMGNIDWDGICSIPYSDYKYNAQLNRCYKFHLTPRNWTDAKEVCAEEESYLAVINSIQERDYLVDITSKASKDDVKGDFLRGGVHLGFYNSNGWTTVNGLWMRNSGYNEWGYEQPDGGDVEECGSMFYNGQLNDIACYQKMFFICEHEIRH